MIYSTCPCCGSTVELKCDGTGEFEPVDFQRIEEAAKGMVDSWDTYRRGEYRFFEEDLKTLLRAIKGD